jgi:hypothetical protein
MLCYAMLCYAMLCYAMLCCACAVNHAVPRSSSFRLAGSSARQLDASEYRTNGTDERAELNWLGHSAVSQLWVSHTSSAVIFAAVGETATVQAVSQLLMHSVEMWRGRASLISWPSRPGNTGIKAKTGKRTNCDETRAGS